jgi:NADH-quinone oxidoreductase subunit M
MYKRVVFGAVANDKVAGLKDIGALEMIVLGLAAAAVLFMGVYPLPFTEVLNVSVEQLLGHAVQSKL